MGRAAIRSFFEAIVELCPTCLRTLHNAGGMQASWRCVLFFCSFCLPTEGPGPTTLFNYCCRRQRHAYWHLLCSWWEVLLFLPLNDRADFAGGTELAADEFLPQVYPRYGERVGRVDSLQFTRPEHRSAITLDAPDGTPATT